ncbi:ArsR/SmtB family transcription factor [Microbacterium resistens]|uniref:Metalloregulator ArsR/SmtB family transcription factor n=1 Tax=Microbacterium resistens TaxID=156977 RepID=A0ABY3RNR4_9MICO|nr:metalloregulator ArsR/SmtB family transcription factor [Microbacterium resistens]MBW1640690.1 helix-turn-helix transcriptional regulator [Microbacterium resistens]UGS25416.1 metalloregulator ArsR/SmtB family transcription factor [Microbacterium resistens]
MLSDPNRPLYEVKAGLFKGLAHPIRIRILEVLSAAPEVSVSELLDVIDLEASHVSQHLAVLRRNRLVVSERRGSLVYYRLAYPQVADLLRVARALLGEILRTTQEQLVEQGGLPDIPVRA